MTTDPTDADTEPTDEVPPDQPGDDATDDPTENAEDPGVDGGAARAASGLDQLQAAAQEVISAARAVLDVAEDLLHDPRTAEAVGTALSSIERAAGRAAVTGRRAAGSWAGRPEEGDAGDDHGEDDDDGSGPGVQRIPVS